MKHELTVKTESYECGNDHYCNGHTDHIAVCSCGWSKDLFGITYSDTMVVANMEHMKRRLEALEAR